MKKYHLVLLTFFLLIECGSAQTILKKQDNWQQLNLGLFKISVPQNWKYEVPNEQEDSFVGQITGPQIQLFFDYSKMGYANHLVQTEQEYLNSKNWIFVPSYLYEVGADISSLQNVKKISKPVGRLKTQFPKADYIGELDYKGHQVLLPITVPAEIKKQFIKIDTTDLYTVKTIWPKVTGTGITGIYIHSRLSGLNFQMNGKNLSSSNQKLALEAFKTIALKK